MFGSSSSIFVTVTDGDIGKMIVDFTGFQVSEALEYLRRQDIIVTKAGE